MGRRILATRFLTGEVLHNDLDVLAHSTTRELNGPGGVFGRVSPTVARLRGRDGRRLLEPWTTGLYCVDDTTWEIISHGLVTSVADEGAQRDFFAPGLTNVPNGQPFLGTYDADDFEDPVTIYRALIAHLAAFPGGNLGLNVDADPTYLVVGSGGEPFQIIQTEYRDVGATMSQLLEASMIDYTERAEFVGSVNASSSPPIRHSVRLGFPRLGGNKTLTHRFTEGENVSDVSEVVYGGEDQSEDITVIGAGEGWAQVDDGLVARGATFTGRVRRAKVVSDPSLQTPAQVEMRLKNELAAATGSAQIEGFTVIDHPNAPINSLHPGDDIILTYYSDHHGQDQSDYLRIVTIEESSETPGRATIACARSDSFTYMPPDNPHTDGGAFLIEV